MTTPTRMVPLLEQYDFARNRLVDRLVGPFMDSGDDERVAVPPLTDAEYLWEPAAGSWSIRSKSAGPGPGASLLVGAGDWGRDAGQPRPYPLPITTIAWRLGHLSEMFSMRADYTIGGHSLTGASYVFHGDAAGGLAAFIAGTTAWREALLSADEAALDQVGYCRFPDGSDPDDPFIDVVWWVNQELLHHGAEIALLRDLYRAKD